MEIVCSSVCNDDVTILVKCDSAAMSSEHEGFSLHEAARKGDVAQLNELLATGCNVNATDHKNATALYVAVCCMHMRAVRVLLDAGARVSQGNSVMHVAARIGFNEAISALLAAGGERRR